MSGINLNEKRLGAAQGTNLFRDGATGSPVIEIGYTQILPYLKRLIWRHINKLRWYREVNNSRPQDE
ncbi:hypothetical protein COL68_23925 [Bacillus wiedmannii]|nr:hypothetical protein TU65_25360 [Bacillus wiedmannii]PEN02036.1 hypothetical protein CN621_08150 [Bacillus wiedmannii]PEP50153.1 hypothetical protein CN557_22245 [Bacillus wiedmannii]PFZ53263.1 hypothetical protein COL68_23925 [Bacillus wiedmannii]PGA01010.1 hypothetical protein COL78_05040 [Bacillus wiedmannii]